MKNANIPYNRKHPIILASSTIAKLIIADAHEKTLHGGLGLMMNFVRENYRILSLRNLVKGHILNCVTCCRFRKSHGQQKMADFPVPRVNLTIAFTHTGVDYAGPFQIKASNIRSPPIRIKPVIINGEVIKAMPKVPIFEGYVALFVCLSTKARSGKRLHDGSFLGSLDTIHSTKKHASTYVL